jgi:hypothetical protein
LFCGQAVASSIRNDHGIERSKRIRSTEGSAGKDLARGSGRGTLESRGLAMIRPKGL